MPGGSCFCNAPRPLFRNAPAVMSALHILHCGRCVRFGPEADSRNAAKKSLFDHLIGAGEQRRCSDGSDPDVCYRYVSPGTTGEEVMRVHKACIMLAFVTGIAGEARAQSTESVVKLPSDM